MSKYKTDDIIFEYGKDENSSQIKVMNRIKPGSRVLEFGPGHGGITKVLSETLSCKVSICEIDESAFNDAIKYATRGILCDIDNYEWEEYFCDELFDYILFTDVLEHLHNPKIVLQKIANFLVEDGHVLISVPNIAHADIINNLILNNFEYTNIGLLDNTHIHLFAYHSFQKLILECNYVSVFETYTKMSPYQTEQSEFLTEISKSELSRAISILPLKNAYQLIFDLQKASSVDRHAVVLESEIINSLTDITDDKQIMRGEYGFGNLYFDFGEGVSQDCRYEFTVSLLTELFSERIYLPKGLKMIRLDPIENYACVISGLCVKTPNNDHLVCKSFNGISLLENEIIFVTTDPIIHFKVNEDLEFIDVSYSILPIDAKHNEHALAPLVNKIKELQTQIGDMENSNSWKLTKPLRLLKER